MADEFEPEFDALHEEEVRFDAHLARLKKERK